MKAHNGRNFKSTLHRSLRLRSGSYASKAFPSACVRWILTVNDARSASIVERTSTKFLLSSNSPSSTLFSGLSFRLCANISQYMHYSILCARDSTHVAVAFILKLLMYGIVFLGRHTVEMRG